MNPKLRDILARVLEIDPAAVGPHTAVENEPRWDSLRHMTLVFALEDGFGVQFADEDLPGLTSVAAIERALAAAGA